MAQSESGREAAEASQANEPAEASTEVSGQKRVEYMYRVRLGSRGANSAARARSTF